MKTTARTILPRPFLKWVGGKGQLLPELVARVTRAGTFHRYHEPFVGGGALFFELVRAEQLPRAKSYLSDTNRNLIDTYCAVRDNVERIIALLHEHKIKHSEAHYYETRAKLPAGKYERAARIIYLNKTGYNGLYRENSKGEFNVPFGRYVNPRICDELNLRAVAKSLRHAQLEVRGFDKVVEHAKAGDLVYFDPPYHPVSKTASFTSYDKGGFGEEMQRALADVMDTLNEKGVKVLLSNSKTPLIIELYKHFTIDEVFASRNVNSKGDRRGKVSEVLVRNF
jgi:DNA adenine methylase